MDVRYINPFVSAVKHVFKTMLSTETLISKPSVKLPDGPKCDVSAVIGFAGPVTGSVTLCFSKQTAVRVASAFAGTELSFEPPGELADALGELANMVAGQAKANLPQANVNISLPRVVLGNGLRLLVSKLSPVLLLPCDSVLGRFAVEVTMTTKKASPFAVDADVAAAGPQPSTS